MKQLLLLCLIALACFGNWCNPTPPKSTEPLSFRAPDLMSEYVRDPDAADKKYKGKQMFISGVVSRANHADNTVSLKGVSSPVSNFIKCHLTHDESRKIDTVVENQGINIEGKNDGWNFGYLEISQCVIKGQ